MIKRWMYKEMARIERVAMVPARKLIKTRLTVSNVGRMKETRTGEVCSSDSRSMDSSFGYRVIRKSMQTRQLLRFVDTF